MLVFSLFLAGGTKGLHLWVILLVLLAGGALLIAVEPYRMARFISFLDPFADRQGGGYQVVQGLLAMGTGGIFGVGLGGSVQKISHLPEAHNDFIMAVIGEETGFVGIAFVICLFVAFFWRCYKVALGQPVLRDKLTAYGLTVAIALSFTMNLAVILSFISGAIISACAYYEKGGITALPSIVSATVSVLLSFIILPRVDYRFAGVFALICYAIMTLLASLVFKRLSGEYPINLKKGAIILLLTMAYATVLYIFRDVLLSRIFLSLPLIPLLLFCAKEIWVKIKE
jgi:cell division protein FtsW (lipid II flippase)